MAVITISRQIGSGGDEIAHRVCEELNYQYFDKQLMSEIATKTGLLEKEVVDFSEDNHHVQSFTDRLFATLEEFRRGSLVRSKVFTDVETWSGGEPGTGGKEVGIWTEDTTGAWTRVVERIGEEQSVTLVNTLLFTASKQGNIVVVGRGGQVVLKDMSGVLHVRIVAPVETRTQRLQQHRNLSREDTQKVIAKHDRAAMDYLKRFHGVDVADPTLYHLVINTGKWDIETAVRIIVNAVKELSST